MFDQIFAEFKCGRWPLRAGEGGPRRVLGLAGWAPFEDGFEGRPVRRNPKANAVAEVEARQEEYEVPLWLLLGIRDAAGHFG